MPTKINNVPLLLAKTPPFIKDSLSLFPLCRSIKSFQQLLYVCPDFTRANEVHLRLGLMLKVNGDYEQSQKHLQLAQNDASPCTFGKLESEYCISISCGFPVVLQQL